MRLIAAGIALLGTLPALAADITWTWVNPVKNTDNSNIPATGPGSLTVGRLEFGTCNGAAFGTKAGEIPLTAAQVAAHTVTETNLLPQTRCAMVHVSNTFLAESAASNVGQAVIPNPTPGAPSGLSGTLVVNVSVVVTP